MDNASTPCPKHPHLAAVMTCARCGTFACGMCKSLADERLCAECSTRHAPVRVDVGRIVQESFNLLGQYPLAFAAFCGGQMIFGLAMLPLTSAMSGGALPGTTAIPELGAIWSLLASSLLLSLGYMSVAYALFIRFLGEALEGRRPSFGEVVRGGIGHAPGLFILNVILAIVLGVGFMLCLVPGLILSVLLLFSLPALVFERTNPLEALSISWNRAKGHFGNCFLLLFVGAAIIIAIGLVGAIGRFVLAPWGTPGVVLHSILQNACGGLGTAFFLLLLVLGYQRLSRRGLPARAR